jgi:hypothetical protein
MLAADGAAQKEAAEFQRRAAELVSRRLSGIETEASEQQQAFAYLDRVVCGALKASGEISLDALNRRLAALISREPAAGENYRVVSLAGAEMFALVANLSLGGPSALRIYSHRAAGREAPAACELAARIDRFSHPDFFDESVDIVPVTSAGGTDAVFVTVSGRTDELRTGEFLAWRFHAGRLERLWSSDILERTSFEASPGGLRLAYCAETEEDRPRICRRMVRDSYIWRDGAWVRIEQTTVPVSKP